MNLIPDVSPKTFSFSAIVVGYLLIDDLTAVEQNALGNWLMLVAQVICTNAFYKQVRQERGLESATNQNTMNDENTIIMMQKMIKALQIEIDNIKNNC